jgi:putative ATP-dependent DNA ligase
MADHETLGIDRETFKAVSEHFQRHRYGDRTYRHLPGYRRQLERGTVLIDDTAVRGFPKIPRTLVLETGVPRHFEETVVVEEKLDGYNTRVVDIDGILAFSRGGMVCPFTTAKVGELLDLEALFDEHPNLMVCGEMVGPENPYSPSAYPGIDSIGFRTFDIRDRESGSPLSVDDRRELCEAFDLPMVPYHGQFSVDRVAPEIRSLIDELDREGREGVIMKSPDGSKLLKYTTSTANQGDLSYAFSLPFDYGQDFMFRRIIREAFQSVEWDEARSTAEARARRLGESILLPMIETVQSIEDGGRVGERHTVRANPAVVDDLFDHLRDQGLHLEIETDRIDGGQRVVTFVKKTQATNDKTRAYLDGTVVKE